MAWHTADVAWGERTARDAIVNAFDQYFPTKRIGEPYWIRTQGFRAALKEDTAGAQGRSFLLYAYGQIAGGFLYEHHLELLRKGIAEQIASDSHQLSRYRVRDFFASDSVPTSMRRSTEFVTRALHAHFLRVLQTDDKIGALRDKLHDFEVGEHAGDFDLAVVALTTSIHWACGLPRWSPDFLREMTAPSIDRVLARHNFGDASVKDSAVEELNQSVPVYVAQFFERPDGFGGAARLSERFCAEAVGAKLVDWPLSEIESFVAEQLRAINELFCQLDLPSKLESV